MHPHEALVRELYARFAAGDSEGMARCYHPDVLFSDPVFPRLRGREACDMWRMLLGRARSLEVVLEDAAGDRNGATARWTAGYDFRGRRVVNRVRSSFAFRDDLIARQLDAFPFWAWARQAFGTPGTLLGWSWPFKLLVRRDAARSLERFSDLQDA